MIAKFDAGYAGCIVGCRLKKNIPRIYSASVNLISMLQAVAGEIYEDRGKNQKRSQVSQVRVEQRGMMSCIAYRGVKLRALKIILAGAGRIGCSFHKVWDSSPFRQFPPSGFLHVLTCPI